MAIVLRNPAPVATLPVASAPAPVAPLAADRPIDRLGLVLLWLTAFSGGFVLIEPSPYEFFSILTMVLFARAGLRLHIGLVPLLFMLILLNVGYATALVPVLGAPKTAQWTVVSVFLALTTLFFAAAMLEDTSRRLDVLMKGYIAAALVVSLIAILAYFRLMPNAERFLLYGRASSTFKDPNVFGPFLIVPGLLVLHRVIHARRFVDLVLYGGFGLLIAAGLFLSFSRGAWGHFVLSALLMMGFGFITSRSPAERLRIVLAAAAGAVLVGLFVAALLSIDQVADLFKQRAALVQDYDAGQTGRFGGHRLGASMALDNPLGIGPIQFSRVFGSEAHNSFITSFLDGGWLGGAVWIAAAFVTLAMGLRHVFVPTPWQRTFIALYAAFVGEVAESYIIDVHHWRHYFLIMGLVWGLMLARRLPLVAAR